MARKRRNINTLPWSHFLRRLYWFKLPHEEDSLFLARAGLTKHNKSKWLNAVQPNPSIDMIERIAKHLELSDEELHWLTFGSRPPLPLPSGPLSLRALPPSRFPVQFVSLAEELYTKRDRVSDEEMNSLFRETFSLCKDHARLGYSALGKAGAPYDPLSGSFREAADWLSAEIRKLKEQQDFGRKTDLLLWMERHLAVIQEPEPESSRPAEAQSRVTSFQSGRSVTGEKDVDSERYFYIPKAVPRLAAGAGNLVTSETSDDYYAFRLDWLNEVASNKGDLWLFEVLGDSMSPTLEAGDVVLIDCGRKVPAHNRIYAFEEDNAITIKRLSKQADGTFAIISDNQALRGARGPLYPPRALSPSIRIIGRMIWSARTWV